MFHDVLFASINEFLYMETYNDAFYSVDCPTPFDMNNRMHLNIFSERAQARETPFAIKQRNTQH